jgi:hypothetical protein
MPCYRRDGDAAPRSNARIALSSVSALSYQSPAIDVHVIGRDHDHLDRAIIGPILDHDGVFEDHRFTCLHRGDLAADKPCDGFRPAFPDQP